jgi:hypothetical protein
METKKGTVTAVTFKKSGQGQYGPYHIFTVVFDNGDSGDYMSKSNPQTSFTIGQSADYTKETKVNGQYTNTTIKVPQQGGFNGFKGGNPKDINKRTSLQCAVEFMKGTKATPEQVFKVADIFNAWLNAGAPQETPKEQPKQEAPPIDEVPEWLR